MPRQRSRKLSEGRTALQKSTPTTSDQHEQDDSHNESLDIMDKDEDELELDRLVLGDQAGFMAQLDQGRTKDKEEDPEEADLEAEVGLGDSDEDMEGVDDADVRSLYELLDFLVTNNHYSYFSLIAHHLQSMETF